MPRKSLYYPWLRTVRIAFRFVQQLMNLSAPLPISRIAGLVTALLVLALGAPSAHAACGDYLHMAKENGARPSEVPGPAQSPCNCPQCSQGPYQLPEAPPVTNRTGGYEPAVVSALDAVPDADRVRFTGATSDRVPTDDAPSPIFHPPR